MIKRILVVFIATIVLLAFSGCAGKKEDARTLQDIITVYENADVEIDVEDKPMYALIKATDGVIFYFDNSPVKIYEYASEKDLEKAKKEYADTVQDWPVNGKFLLETSNKDAIEIFNGIE